MRIIFDLYSKGIGLKRLCKELTALKRKDAYDNVSWSCSKLSRIIRNATYKGYKCYLKSYSNNYLDQKRIKNLDEETYLYVKGDFEPIVEEELWDYCQTLRKKNSMHVRNEDGTMRNFGKKCSSDPYLNVMRCTCGSTFKKFRWHKRRDGTWSYGYQCYNQVNNGTKISRVKLNLDTDGYCDTPMICDWKMDLMAYHIFNMIVDEKQVVLKALEIINRNYVEESAVSKELIAGIEAKIQHIKSRINVLIEMRADLEIDKNEFIEQKRKYDEQLEVLNAELSTAKSGTKIETRKDMDMLKIKDNLAELTNFKERVPSEIIEKFVAQIFPTDNNHFDWFLNFDNNRHTQTFCTLAGKTNSRELNFKQEAQPCSEHPTKFHSDYFLSANELGKNPMQRGLLQKSLYAEAKKTMKPVLTFTLNYEQARWLHHTFYHVMTRPNQWQDLTINVYM